MKNIKNAALAIVAFGFPAAGFAQDASNWTGFYAGVTASKESATSSSKAIGSFFEIIPLLPQFSSRDPAELDDLVKELYDTAPEGQTYGLRAGYNHDLGSGWVAGFEGVANSGTISDKIEDQIVRGAGPTKYITSKLSENFELKTRVGYVAGKTLMFATAGYASTKYSVELDDPAIDDESATLEGFVVGAGVEHMLTDKVSVSLEYIQANYGTHTVFADQSSEQYGSYALNADVASNSIRVGVNYRF